MKWPFTKSKVQVALPLADKWTDRDQKAVSMFLKSEQGLKLFESCRHKLFSDHLDSCQTAGNAETNNAAIRGANNILSHILWLSTQDSISSPSDAKEETTATNQSELEAEYKRSY